MQLYHVRFRIKNKRRWQEVFETDETLIRRILQGKDREAGELLVERHYKRIYKEIYLKTSDEELAKDLTQEAFIQILKKSISV